MQRRSYRKTIMTKISVTDGSVAKRKQQEKNQCCCDRQGHETPADQASDGVCHYEIFRRSHCSPLRIGI